MQGFLLLFLFFANPTQAASDQPAAADAPALDHAARVARAATIPLTIFPEFSLENGGPILTIFNAFARQDDYLLVADVDALRDSFHIEKFRPKVGGLALYSRGVIGFKGSHQDLVAGLRGVYLIPGEISEPDFFDKSPRTLLGSFREQRKRTDAAGLFLASGLNQADSRYGQRVQDVARHSSIFTIYAPQILTRDPVAYYNYFLETAQHARKANPQILIEFGVPTVESQAALQMVYELLLSASEHADRFAIYMQLTRESFETLIFLVDALRPGSDVAQILSAPPEQP